MFNSQQLAKWLREAKDAHQKWEDDYLNMQVEAVKNGIPFVPDLAQDHWPEWYAEWLLPKLQSETFMTVIETVFPELDPRNLERTPK